MRKSFSACDLKSSIKSLRDGDTCGRGVAVGGDGRDQGVQLIPLLLQLLHQALDCTPGKRFSLPTLPGNNTKDCSEPRQKHKKCLLRAVINGICG